MKSYCGSKVRLMFYVMAFWNAGFLCLAHAYADEWQWIRTSPDTTGKNFNQRSWQVLQGKTNLEIKGTRFSFDLNFQDSKYNFVYKIEGAVHGGNVAATELQEYTEASETPLRGTLESYRGKSPLSWGYDRFILSNYMTCIVIQRFVKGAGAGLEVPK